MAQSELTHKDRAYAATAGVSGTPFNTPPRSQSPHNADADDKPTVSLKLPVASYYIIVVEGCERFCFYGLKAILLLYFMNFLMLSVDSATVGYHLFSFACYFTPTIGAVISDGFIGRYATILSSSFVYLFGAFILTITAIPKIGHMALAGPVVGLLLIAFGTGGIKPCVGPFGADQIVNPTANQLSRFFAIFYFSINTGAFVSTIVTPALRSDVQCFGYDCYSLAFGVPTLLMLVAIIIFIIGTPLYRCIPPKENIIAKFIAIICRAIRNAICSRSSERKQHCLYYADDKYSNEDIEDVRAVLRIFLLFTPLPIFYALYNQSGSRWTYQASLMNGGIGPFGTIQPDQMQALNSLFILIFIPIFEEVFYPAFARCNFLIKPLQRMFCGMLVMMLAFIVAALVQLAIQQKANVIPVRVYTNIYNGYDCAIIINHHNGTIQPGQSVEYSCTQLVNQKLVLSSTCNNGEIFYQLSSDELCPSLLIVSEPDDGNGIQFTPLTTPVAEQQGVQQFSRLRMVSLDGLQKFVKTVPNNYRYLITKELIPTKYQSVLPAKYQIENEINGQISTEKFRVYTTAVYTVLIYNSNTTELHATLFEDVPPYTIHILWQTFQYILMTWAEILVSVTGLMFAYSQAPKRYKTVIMSAWLLTSAFGDLIVVFVAEVHLVQNQALEFLLFAILMAFGAFIFGVLAINYKEYQPNINDTEDQQLILTKNSPESEEILQ